LIFVAARLRSVVLDIVEELLFGFAFGLLFEDRIVELQIVLGVVDAVEPTPATLLERTARNPFFVPLLVTTTARRFLRASWWGLEASARTERIRVERRWTIATKRAASRRSAWTTEPATRTARTWPSWRPGSRTAWSIEPTSTRRRSSRRRTARSRSGTGWSIATWGEAARSLGWFRLVDREVATAERLVVKLSDRFLGVGTFGKLHERKPTRPTSLTVEGNLDRSNRTNRGEMVSHVVFGHTVGKVTYEESD